MAVALARGATADAARETARAAAAKLAVSAAAASPMRSCMPPEARRMRLPRRRIGTTATG